MAIGTKVDLLHCHLLDVKKASVKLKRGFTVLLCNAMFVSLFHIASVFPVQHYVFPNILVSFVMQRLKNYARVVGRLRTLSVGAGTDRSRSPSPNPLTAAAVAREKARAKRLEAERKASSTPV